MTTKTMTTSNIFIGTLSMIIFLSSCSVLKTNTAKSLDITGVGVVQNPVLVDLDVQDTKVEGTAEGPKASTEAVKQEAVANAIEKAKADVLVEPKFTTVTTKGRVTVTVTGFPATYKNFRPLKEEDIKLLEAGLSQSAVVHEPTKAVRTKKGIRIAAAGAGALGTILIFFRLFT